MTADELDVRPIAQTRQAPHNLRRLRRPRVRASRSSWSTTTTPSTCMTSSRSSTPAATAGTTSSRDPRLADPDHEAGVHPPASPPGQHPALTADNPDAAGATWKLQMRERDLDSNIIRLPPDGHHRRAHRARHRRPHPRPRRRRSLITERGTLALEAGALLWLPRRSRRQFIAGPDGLSYLTVHQRRQALTLTAPEHL